MNSATTGWGAAARRAFVSGSIASVLSTAMLALCGRIENGAAAGPINGPSQWLWGRWAARVRKPSVRHTLTGHAVHHVCSCGWALLYERWLGPKRDKSPAAALGQAAATAALACFVDYRLTPERLQPGFEKQLSKPSLLAVYAAFAAGLAIARTIDRPRSTVSSRDSAPPSRTPPASSGRYRSPPQRDRAPSDA